jgi:hypothetical protein
VSEIRNPNPRNSKFEIRNPKQARNSKHQIPNEHQNPIIKFQITSRLQILTVVFINLLALFARAHDPLLDLPPPNSIPEAWNVITQSIANIEKCLETHQLKEIANHVSNCSPALRVLQADAKARGDKALYDRLEALYYSGDAIITATRQGDEPVEKGRRALAAHRAALEGVMGNYKPEVLRAVVYACPMHPLERSLDPATPCPKCGMKLIRRRIPASATYEKPGAPSMKLVATTDRPLKVGERASVTIKLTKLDGTPITRADLLVMHTQKIHLLIVDRSLMDYHHEHPAAGEKAGEYVFSFTPARPGAYRIFADVVPAETGVQEYVIGDIAADTAAEPLERNETRLTSEVDGFVFSMKFDQKLTAGQPIDGELTVTAPDSRPFKELEPVMGAFAHLVAFHEDHKTVLHIHPQGQEPQTEQARGGPVLKFKLYAPVAGYYRLYAQVQVMGEQKFAPFDIAVEK